MSIFIVCSFKPVYVRITELAHLRFYATLGCIIKY